MLKEAGHDNLRLARGPMGFTQRQAGGKFTRDEAAQIIGQLQDTEIREPVDAAGPVVRPSPTGHLVRRMPADELAQELRRRGWTVVKP